MKIEYIINRGTDNTTSVGLQNSPPITYIEHKIVCFNHQQCTEMFNIPNIVKWSDLQRLRQPWL